MPVTLTRVDGKLTGSSRMGEEGVVNFTEIEEKDNAITIYFTANGYDITLYLEKKDVNNAEGSMMEMFDAYAKRIVKEE